MGKFIAKPFLRVGSKDFLSTAHTGECLQDLRSLRCDLPEPSTIHFTHVHAQNPLIISYIDIP